MAKSAAPLILLAGAGAVFLSGKKKRKSSSKKAPPATHSVPPATNEHSSSSSTPENGGSSGHVEEQVDQTSSEDYPDPPYFTIDGDNTIWVPETGVPDEYYLNHLGETSEYSGLYAERQSMLRDLGYYNENASIWIDGVWGPISVDMVRLFQQDWNFFVSALKKMNPSGTYSAPYTEISTDGFWGPETDSRINKALGKIPGDKAHYVEELGYEVNTFRQMVNGLKEIV